MHHAVQESVLESITNAMSSPAGSGKECRWQPLAQSSRWNLTDVGVHRQLPSPCSRMVSPSYTKAKSSTTPARTPPSTEKPSGYQATQPPRHSTPGSPSSTRFAPKPPPKTPTATSPTRQTPSTRTATPSPHAREIQDPNSSGYSPTWDPPRRQYLSPWPRRQRASPPTSLSST